LVQRFLSLPDCIRQKDRKDIDALVLVKKLGMKVIATVSMVTYDPVWKAEPFADLCA
jgi:hypothetical protein